MLATATTGLYLLFILAQFGSSDGVHKFCFKDTNSCYIRDGETIVSRVNSGEIPPEQRSEVRGKRHAIMRFENRSNIWKDGVKYYFDSSITLDINGKGMSQKLMKEFGYAVEAWQRDTCVNFERVLPPNVFGKQDNRDVLRVSAYLPGCSSHPGRFGGEQPLILGEGCESFGHIAHELGHALGLYHTMARHDRNNYVTVMPETMEKEYHGEFEQQSEEVIENYRIGYDYGSIMHYPSRSLYSKGKQSIIPSDRRYSSTMGSEMISFVDLWTINKLYSCEDICAKNKTIDCKYGGFPHPRNCSKCLCPGGYGGDDCSEIPNDGCGEKLQAKEDWEEKTIIIQNHNPEKFLDGYKKCTYWIQSPENTKIKIQFKADYFEEEASGCIRAGVEIKTNQNQTLTGYRLCSYEADDWEFTSATNLVPVIAYSREKFVASVATIKYKYVKEDDGKNN